jgi:hypothetical protein
LPTPRARFTIRSLMIVIAAAAVLMALPGGWAVLAGMASFICLAFAVGVWVERRGHRRLAAVGFWAPAILINVLYAAACLTPILMLSNALLVAWLVFFAPVIGRFGVSWALLATRETAAPRRRAGRVWAAAVGLTLLPSLTVLSFWPLLLGFALARPAMNRLADQAAAGQPVVFPRRVGPFWLLRAGVDPVSGQVGLMIEPNPSRPTGFVRVLRDDPPGTRRPIIGTELYVELGGGWSYREDD